MVNLSNLAFLALAATSASAVSITFKRWTRVGCEEAHAIHRDVHLHDPHCKTFTHHEPVFHSFMVRPENGRQEMSAKYCKATVYEQPDCKGHGFTYGDMLDYADRCGNTTIGGRSVRISCEPRPQTVLSSSMPPPPPPPPAATTSHTTEVHEVEKEVTVTVAGSPVAAPHKTTTMMLYPCEHEAEQECGV